MTKPNLLDHAVALFSPAAAIKRVSARAKFEALGGGYTGASRSRGALTGWTTRRGDADADTLADIPLLRERCADLVRNNPLAGAASNTKVTHVVGTGLKLNAAIDASTLGLSEEKEREINSLIEREWRIWSSSPDCDVQRQLSFTEQQELAFRSVLDAGDHFVLLTKAAHKGAAYPLALQHIEADRVCNRDNKVDGENTSAGVTKDSSGAPISYDVKNTHPGANSVGQDGWKTIPAFGKNTGRRITLHLFRTLRTSQTRGVPDLAPVLEPIKQLGRYMDAEIDAAVKNSVFAFFVKTETGEGLGMAGLEYNDWTSARKEYYKESPIDLKGGESHVAGLFPDDSVESFDPNRPNAAFDPFMQAMLSLIAAQLELPVDVLTKRFQSSYSAARAALLELSRYVAGRRKWLAAKFCQPVYEQFVADLVLDGKLQAPGFFNAPAVQAAYCKCEWIGDAPGHIDETKAVGAARDRIEAGLSTKKREIPALTGEDYETTQRQLDREREADQDREPMPGPQADLNEQPKGLKV